MDDEVIRILIEIKQFTQSVRQIRQVADEVKKLGTATTGQAKAATQTNASLAKSFNAVGAQIRQQRAAAAQLNKTTSFRQPPIGRYSPAQRLQRQIVSLRGALASGDPNAIFDAQYGAHMLHQRVQQAKNFMNPMSIQARNISNAMAPIGALMSAIGSVATPVMAVVGAFTALVGAVVLMTKAAIDAGAAFAKIGLTAGGTGEQSALLDVFGKTVGADLSGPAREFAAAISHGGEAGGFAARAGIFHHGTFDTTNVAQEYLKAIEYMRKLPREEALRMARAIPGLETAAPLLNVSEGQFNKMKGDAGLQSRIFAPKFQEETADFMSALARIGEAFNNFAATVIKPFLPMITVALNGIADVLQLFAESTNTAWGAIGEIFDSVIKPMLPEFSQWFKELSAGLMVFATAFADFVHDVAGMIRDHQDLFKGIAEIIHGILTLDIDKVMQGQKDIMSGIKGGNAPKTDPLIDALNRNARAVEDNTASYATRNGTYGGGERAHGAVPSKWSGMNTERYIGEARRLGAFAL